MRPSFRNLVALAILTLAPLSACENKKSDPGKDEAKKEDPKKTEKTSTTSGGSSAGSPASSTPAPAAGGSTSRLDFPNSDEGLKSLLGEFTKPGAKADEVLGKLKPDAADYEAVFEGDAAKKIQESSAKLFEKGGLGVKEGDAIEIKASGTTDDFKAFKDGSPVERHCPGGYKRVGPVMKPGQKFYCVKIGGTTLDAFAYVNGHWVLFPKPFRALKE